MKIVVRFGDSEVRGMLRELSLKVQDMTPAMREIGEVILTSVEDNFNAQGRPGRWTPSKRVLKEGGQTLSNTARLRRSFTGSPEKPADAIFRVGRNRVEVGTNVVYAAVHQFGIGRRSSLKSKRTMPAIPARPFLMIQEDDRRQIIEILNRYLKT